MMSRDGLSSLGTFNEDPKGIPSFRKRKRSLPGAPDPNSEVVALSPKSLMATNRFICEVCNKGFQREQNLQLHRRGHNLPWKLKQRTNKEDVKRKVYICPEKSCVHNDPSRALGDLTGIKKHYSRKHGEKRWKCQKCSKKYAVLSDLKAHTKICGTREYKCDCGTTFSRKDSFTTHRAFCDALAHQNASSNLNLRSHEVVNNSTLQNNGKSQFFAIFRPPQVGGFASRNQLNLDLQKLSRTPLWLDTGNNNPIGNARPPNANYLVSTSTFLPELDQISTHNDQWYFNRPMVLKEEETAPQMDGLMNSFYGLNSVNQGRNELLFHQNLGKFQDMNGDQGLWLSEINSNAMVGSSRNIDPLLLMTNAGPSYEVGGGNSLTRDFLGMGVSENRRFLQENELMTRFASVDSAMNMSSYSRIHHGADL